MSNNTKCQKRNIKVKNRKKQKLKTIIKYIEKNKIQNFQTKKVLR